MQIEVIIVAVIVFGIMTITGQISMNQLISDNQLLFLKIKEKDWDFLVRAKYGTNVNPDILFNKRIKNALITMAIAFAIMIKDLNAVKVLLIFVLGIFVFKSSYNDIKKYYQRHMAQIDSINAGDDSIEPYMAFARKYPVRDSMRMMRLLYRLSLGRQERKQEQILTFSRSISSLQQKARETRYKNRLEKMEGKTMSMLITTGVGLMVLLILAVIQLMPT